jgi:phospholipid/cholesterol/gamma-HCH transport system permease protein
MLKKNIIQLIRLVLLKTDMLLKGLGQAVAMTLDVAVYVFKGHIPVKDTISQMVDVGWCSAPIVMFTSFFAGMVLSLQIGSATMNIFNESIYVGTVTGFSLVMELGPVLTAIIITGRVGAAITAELATMKVTEQIDALYTLGTNPIKFLAVSRFLACFFMLPMLTTISNIVGVYGGMLVSTNLWKVPSSIYWSEVLDFMTVRTFLHGFIKSFFFAFVIIAVSCHKGFNANGGAKGVGRATTSSVMSSIVLILFSDYFLTSLLIALKIK